MQEINPPVVSSPTPNIFYLPLQRKSWMLSKGDTRVNRDVITTMLASQGDNSVDECVDKLLAEDISYRDLSSLTDKDLEMMGFKYRKQRDDLLEFFAQLPNQDPSYQDLCNLPEAKDFNRQMLGRATGHLEQMRAALAAASYKLEIQPPEDVVVGDKYFASRFVIEALSEVENVTKEIDKEIENVEKLIAGNSKALKKESPRRYSTRVILILSAIVTGVLAGWCIHKLRK